MRLSEVSDSGSFGEGYSPPRRGHVPTVGDLGGLMYAEYAAASGDARAVAATSAAKAAGARAAAGAVGAVGRPQAPSPAPLPQSHRAGGLAAEPPPVSVSGLMFARYASIKVQISRRLKSMSAQRAIGLLLFRISALPLTYPTSHSLPAYPRHCMNNRGRRRRRASRGRPSESARPSSHRRLHRRRQPPPKRPTARQRPHPRSSPCPFRLPRPCPGGGGGFCFSAFDPE